MKTINILITALLLLSFFSFKKMEDEIEKCLIKKGETLTFSSKGTTSISVRQGSYDGSGFELTLDEKNNIILSNIAQATGPKQDELLILNCTGILTKTNDKLDITFKKYREHYYLFSLDKGLLVGTFDTIVRVSLQTEQSNGRPAAFYCTQKSSSGVHLQKKMSKADSSFVDVVSDKNPTHQQIDLTAVPPGIKKDELFVKNHPTNTLAFFSTFEVEIASGKVLTFPKGSYIICEGKSFVIE